MAREDGQRREVAFAGQRRVQRRTFDQGADPGQVVRWTGERMPENCAAPSRWADEPEQHPQGCRLARSVRPDEAGDRSGGNGDVEAVDDGSAAEAFGEPAHVDRRRMRLGERRRRDTGIRRQSAGSGAGTVESCCHAVHARPTRHVASSAQRRDSPTHPRVGGWARCVEAGRGGPVRRGRWFRCRPALPGSPGRQAGPGPGRRV